MPKFFVKTNQIKENEILIIGEDVKHISQVLRAKTGEELTLCNASTGLNYLAKIEKIEPESIKCSIIKIMNFESESNVEVTVFQGLPKADKMEFIVQKTTELGVKYITPVNMKRCIAKWNEKEALKKLERLNKIAESAAKQSGRNFIPEVKAPINFQALAEKVKEFDLMLVAYENEENNTLKAELKKIKNFEKIKIGIVIGPEGGLEKEEVEKLLLAGAKIITLGKRILRTETASIAVISNIMYEFEM